MLSKRSRKVIRYSQEMQELKRYNSLKEVCAELGVSQSYSSYLLKTIKAGKILHNSYWKFQEHLELEHDEFFIDTGYGFEVSNFGTCRSPTGYLTKGCVRSGYMSYTKGKKSWYVHRIVAQTFLENPDNLPTVNHIDYNHFNNRIDNLEWASYKHQATHRDNKNLTF